MKCECKNCKHCRLYAEGAFCDKRMIFVDPDDRCNDFDTDKVVGIWNNILTYLAIITITALAFASILS